MAGAVTEEQLARKVFTALQAASCPLVEGADLQEADSMLLQLLCVPSQNTTDFLAWICSSFNPNSCSSKVTSIRSKDPAVLSREIYMLGQELMLCKADELDLIREGSASFRRKLQFLEQLLTLLPSCKTSAVPRIDTEMLLNELFTTTNLPYLSQMLEPTLDPWPSHKTFQKDKSSSKTNKKHTADVAMPLQQTCSALEQLRSECEFLNNEEHSPGIFSLSSLRVAACDLQQLMATFHHVLETDLRAYCGRDPPSFSTEANVFQRVHQLLQAFITELEMLKEVLEASVSVYEEVNQLQTQPRY